MRRGRRLLVRRSEGKQEREGFFGALFVVFFRGKPVACAVVLAGVLRGARMVPRAEGREGHVAARPRCFWLRGCCAETVRLPRVMRFFSSLFFPRRFGWSSCRGEGAGLPGRRLSLLLFRGGDDWRLIWCLFT